MLIPNIYFILIVKRSITFVFLKLVIEIIEFQDSKIVYFNILIIFSHLLLFTVDYADPLKKQVTSKYGKGLFLKTQTCDGTVYNVGFIYSYLIITCVTKKI